MTTISIKYCLLTTNQPFSVNKHRVYIRRCGTYYSETTINDPRAATWQETYSLSSFWYPIDHGGVGGIGGASSLYPGVLTSNYKLTTQTSITLIVIQSRSSSQGDRYSHNIILYFQYT